MYQNIHVKPSSNEAWVWDDKKGLQHFKYTPFAYRKDATGKHKSIYGDKLTRVTNFAKGDPNLMESDIPDATRVLIDMYSESDMVSTGHKILTLDIEVEMITGIPDPQLGNNEITSIAFFDSVTNHYTILILDKKQKVESKTSDNKTIVSCIDEKTLLLKFLNALEEIQPTIFTGWNISGFDIPYTCNRIKNVLGNKHANRLSPIGYIRFSPHKNSWSIAGVSSLDYMRMYKKFSYKELPSYALNYVSNIELGRGKIEYEGNLDDLMENDIEKFIEYNITDVELVVELDKKLQYIELVRGICHIGHVPYEDYVYSTRYLEGALLTYLRKINVIAPNKLADRQEIMAELEESGEEGFAGAYVKDPIPGRYEWIYDLDLTSLYPSIIMSLNISPETKVGKVDKWNVDEYIKKQRDTYTINGEDISRETLSKFLEKYKYSIASNGVMYRTDVVGLLPAILDEWFDKRVEYVNEMNKWGREGDQEKYQFFNKRQLVQKILLNSMYGALGTAAFRFFDIDNAEATTISGQTIIKKTQDVINLKYNSELKKQIKITLEDGSVRILTETSLITILRNNKQMEIFAKDLLKTDDILI